MTEQLAFYFQAFAFLSNRRSYGMSGPNPISFSEVCTYAEKIGYTGSEDLFFLSEVILACDQVYLEDYRKRSEAESKKKSAGSKARSRK